MGVLRVFGDDAGDQDVHQVFFDLGQHFGFLIKIIVLGRDHDGINAYRFVVVRILQGYL
ncbi:hypothetical protein D3C87_2166700 [compost metagenome]